MFQEQEGSEGVDLEGVEGMGIVDLRGRFLGVEDTGEAEGKAKIVGGGREAGFAMRGSSRDGGFICVSFSGFSVLCKEMGEYW